MTRILLILMSAFFTLNILPAIAQDKTKIEKLPVSGPVQKWMEAEGKMTAPLNKDQRESVFILRNKYSYIRVIGVAKRDIGNAVSSCGKKNSDMKKTMDDRFTQWKNAVDPIIKTAQKQLDSDIDAQTIVKPSELRGVMMLNDKAFEYEDKKIEKKPVTTKEACQGLLESMNDTENNMVKLLRETLLPEQVIKSRDKMNKKEQAKAAEQQKAKEKSQKNDAKPTEDKKPQ